MPDSKAGAWAAIDGQEIVNSQRTISYIQNLGLPITIDEDCWCPQIKDLLACEDPVEPYYYPASDPAPWFDSAIAESSGFLGFLVTEFEGLGSTYQRPTFPSLSGGSLLGRLRPAERTLTWKGYLFGTNCCSAEYGLRWLTAALATAGGCDGCEGSNLEVLLCCPDIIECDDCDPAVGNDDTSNAFRTFYNTGLADGPKILSQRTIGCGGDCDKCSGCLIEIEFSIVAGNPFMHRAPVTACDENFPSCGICPGEAEIGFWNKVITATYPASTDDAKGCTNLLTCLVEPEDCLDDPNCPLPVLPEIPGFTDPCGCEAYNLSEICCEISNDIYGQFFEGIPQISVFSGDEALHNVTIKFYENPQERDCTDKSLFDICNLCDSVVIRYVPANSTLTLDGLTKQINIECVGNNVNPAENLVSNVFQWPTFKCIDYIVKVATDCNYPVATNAKATICVIPREM